MPDAPYFKDMFSEGILKHTSMTAYLPVVGIAGGLAFCRGAAQPPVHLHFKGVRGLRLCAHP